MSKVIGIDLGTTNSCVAVMEGKNVVVIANSEGARTTPSIVAFADGGSRLVGQIAKRQSVTNPENTVHAVKRLMGRKFDASQVERLVAMSPYEIVAAPNGDAHVKVRGKVYSPPEISAMVLTRMRETAEDYLGDKVTEAVITVPAYFDDAQRQATKDAGRIAGLDVLRIINEPTAAALAYGLTDQTQQRVAVYDLGGGTFDISILELADGIFHVRATNGDTFLGGEDFDNALVQHLIDLFAEQHDGVDLRSDKMALQRVREAAEKAKHELSSAMETDLNLPFIAVTGGGPVHMQATLRRSQLEDLVEPYIQRTLEPCRKALADIHLKPRDIDVVILVGGQTRMPRVQEVVAQFFGREASRNVNPDEVVAVGAAIQGAVLTGEVQEVLLLDVTPLSLGVETAGGVFTRLIPRNTTIPTRATEVFSTAMDNQDFVNVHVLQGERDMAADNKSLAYFQLVGIAPAPRGVPRIEVAFDIDANGIMTVSAKDLGTGKEQSVNVVPTSGLSEPEIERIMEDAIRSAEGDQSRRALAEAKNRAESLLYTSERALGELGHVLGDEDRGRLEGDIEQCRRVLESGTLDEVLEAVVRLEASAQRIGEVIYAQADGGGSEGG
ncbi:MAG TPA: molecular chaperone DnaK [Kofleriaceae bacterium]|nr:molecular chaperone DnaK [Kofleriaceae bacterium]